MVGANYLPTDGYVDPTMLTNALAKGARSLGAQIHRRTCVMDMIVRNGVVTEVVTDKGNIKAEIVVNAAGIWAREIGKNDIMSQIQQIAMLNQQSLPTYNSNISIGLLFFTVVVGITMIALRFDFCPVVEI